MATRYDLIVFDWDGTLMDSAAKIVQCFSRAYADANVAYPGDRAVRRIIGLGLHEALVVLMPDTDAKLRERVSAGYRNYFINLDASETALFPNVREGLSALASQGYLLAVATGKSRRGLNRVLEHTDLGSFFVTSRCADEALSKPHPRMLEDILTATAVAPARALMVGDTTYDLQMARSAGVDGLGVSYGVHDRSDLLAHEPLACCDSFDEVMTWITDQSVQSANAANS